MLAGQIFLGLVTAYHGRKDGNTAVKSSFSETLARSLVSDRCSWS